MKQYCKSLPTHWKEHVFFGFWSKVWNILDWHFPPLSLMWFGVDNKKPKQSKFEPFVDNYRGLQLFHLFHQHHPYHNHKLPHHHLPIFVGGRVCYLISSSAMSAAVSPHVLLLRTARSILIFLTTLSLISWLAPHFLWDRLYPKSIPHNVLQNVLLLRIVRSILIFLTSLSPSDLEIFQRHSQYNQLFIKQIEYPPEQSQPQVRSITHIHGRRIVCIGQLVCRFLLFSSFIYPKVSLI